MTLSRHLNISTFLSLAATSLAVAVLTTRTGYSWGPLILLIWGFLTLYKVNWRSIASYDWWVIGAFVGFFLYIFIRDAADGGSFSESDNPSRFFAAMVVLLLFTRHKLNPTILLSGFALGALGAFGLAVHDIAWLGMERAGGGLLAISFGNIALLMAFICFLSFVWMKRQGKSVAATVFLICFVLGCLVSIMSGTRGGWLAVPWLIFLLVANKQSLNGPLIKWAVPIGLLSIGVAIYSLDLDIVSRLELAVVEVQSYLDGQVAIEQSAGVRLELWRVAIHLFLEHPIFGTSIDQHQHLKSLLVQEGQFAPFIMEFGHAHNEYLDFASKYGLSGLIFLLGIFFAPMAAFIHYYRKAGTDTQLFALCGLTVVVNFMIYSLTQAVFSHHTDAISYAFFSMYFLVLCRQSDEAAQAVSLR